jgi:hypothetical protein
LQGLERIVQSWHGVLQAGLFQISNLASIKASVLLLPLLVLTACDSASPDRPNVIISNANNLVTSEDGATAYFGVLLSIQPVSTVRVPISSSDTSEGTVDQTVLVFDPNNWSAPQTVIITGADDNVADGDVGYAISIGSLRSSDEAYNGLNPADLTVVNLDNDGGTNPAPSPPPSPPTGTPGVSVEPTSGLVTTENMTTAQVSVVLNAQPGTLVRINVTVSDATEGTVSPTAIFFTSEDWDEPQTVTVTGIDDQAMDGDVEYAVNFSVQSNDTNYNGIAVNSVAVTNQDNDLSLPAVGVTVSPTAGLITSEAMTSTPVSVVLDSQPSDTVTITLISSDTGEGVVAPASLQFDSGNWNTPQAVTITGVDDQEIDGDIAYTIGFSVQSNDANYNGITVTSVSLTNQDNDVAQPEAGVIVSPTAGLLTSEDMTTTAISIVLNSQPTDAVSIAASSSDATEGTLTPASIQFDATNWDAPQTITVTGVDDQEVDGDMAFTVGFSVQSIDAGYDGIAVTSVSVTNQDNDAIQTTPGVTVSPTAGLITAEDATTADISIVLDAQPTDIVSIAMTSSDTTEGAVSPASIQFDATNWDVSQTITVTGVDDQEVDGDIAYTISFAIQSNDANYDGFSVGPVSVTNQDNDVVQSTPGVTVSPTAGLLTSEELTSTPINVVLDAQPTDIVTISVSSSDTSEGSVAPTTLEFDASNWEVAQTVTVTGVDDSEVDGDVSYTVDFSVQSNDAGYDGIAVTSVSVSNQDNDVVQPAAGVTVSPIAGLITSEDLTATDVTIVLDAQPSDSVVITASSSDNTEGTVAPASLQFDSSNWDTAQTVTVTGVDDQEVDGDIAYSINFAVQSGDANYDAITVSSVSLTNQDNDAVPPTAAYLMYIEPGTQVITASEISGNGATSFPVWGYSSSNLSPGISPGIVIDAVVGQLVSVEIVNDHILDHGFEIPGLLANTNIPGGESVVIEFTPTEAGVYRYGDPDPRSRAMGMFGAVVVRPVAPNTAWTNGPGFDQERTWVVTDMDETWNSTLWFNPVPSTYNPNYFLLNGKNGFAAKQDPLSTLDGVVGETFLVRIVNAGQYDQSLHFHANHFQIISQDGVKVNDIADAPWVTTVNVKRGSTATVLYTLDKPGTYPVHVHSANMETGNGVYLNGTATFIIAQ